MTAAVVPAGMKARRLLLVGGSVQILSKQEFLSDIDLSALNVRSVDQGEDKVSVSKNMAFLWHCRVVELLCGELLFWSRAAEHVRYSNAISSMQ